MASQADKARRRKMVRILRIRDVQKVTGLSRATIYRKLAAHSFPEPVRLAPQTVGWRDTDVQVWIASLTSVGEKETA